MNKDQLKKVIGLIEILALVILVICVIILVTQNMKLQKIKVQEQQNEQTLLELQEKIDSLKEELEYKQTDEYLDEWAKENGYVKDGEQQYRPE